MSPQDPSVPGDRNPSGEEDQPARHRRTSTRGFNSAARGVRRSETTEERDHHRR